MREKLTEYCLSCKKPVEVDIVWGNASQEGIKALNTTSCPICGGKTVYYHGTGYQSSASTARENNG